jgi:4-oxalocrotonate tautomerase
MGNARKINLKKDFAPFYDRGKIMPLVRISMNAGRTDAIRAAISDAVHQAMVDTIKVPADDKFQIIAEHGRGQVVFDANYLGVKRTDGIVIVQITLNAGRTVEMKKALYARIAQLLHEKAGVRPEDVVISLTEVAKEDWSFGNGVASYAAKAT